MKKFLFGLVLINIAYSIFLIVEKWQKKLQNDGCAMCNQFPVSEFQLAIIALATSVFIGILLFLKDKHVLFWYLSIIISGMSAIIASALLRFQMGIVHSFCLTCFISECMFYLIFIFFVFYSISPWLKNKWNQE